MPTLFSENTIDALHLVDHITLLLPLLLTTNVSKDDRYESLRTNKIPAEMLLKITDKKFALGFWHYFQSSCSELVHDLSDLHSFGNVA